MASLEWYARTNFFSGASIGIASSGTLAASNTPYYWFMARVISPPAGAIVWSAVHKALNGTLTTVPPRAIFSPIGPNPASPSSDTLTYGSTGPPFFTPTLTDTVSWPQAVAVTHSGGYGPFPLQGEICLTCTVGGVVIGDGLSLVRTPVPFPPYPPVSWGPYIPESFWTSRVGCTETP